MTIAAHASRLLLRELRAFQREILLFPDDVTLWQTLPGVANSAGNLALHLSGNLQHFVGRVVGHSAYARNREDEFGRRAGTRQEVVASLEAAMGAVQGALQDAALEGEFPERPAGHRIDAGLFLMHLCAHAGFHLGQAGYLRRVLTGDPRTSGALPLQDIAL